MLIVVTAGPKSIPFTAVLNVRLKYSTLSSKIPSRKIVILIHCLRLVFEKMKCSGVNLKSIGNVLSYSTYPHPIIVTFRIHCSCINICHADRQFQNGSKYDIIFNQNGTDIIEFILHY